MRTHLPRLVPLALLVAVPPGPARAFIDGPPTTLGRLCAVSNYVAELRLEKASADKGVLVFRKARYLKGRYPAGTVRLAGPGAPEKALYTVDEGERQELFRAAGEGGAAVLFILTQGQRNFAQLYCGSRWYGCGSVEGDGRWGDYRLACCDPRLRRVFFGPAGRLARATEEILGGKEPVVPCLADADTEDLRAGRSKVQRLRAGLKRLDYRPRQDFAGWGEDEARAPTAGVIIELQGQRVVVRVAGKDRAVELRAVRVFTAKGRPVKEKDIRAVLGRGTAVLITEKDGQVAELLPK